MRKNKNIAVRRTERSILHGSNKDDKKRLPVPNIEWYSLYKQKSLCLVNRRDRSVSSVVDLIKDSLIYFIALEHKHFLICPKAFLRII